MNKLLAPRFCPTTFSCKSHMTACGSLSQTICSTLGKPSDLPPLPAHPVVQTQMTHLVDTRTHTHTSFFHTCACMHARCLQPLHNQKFRTGEGDFANSLQAAGRIVQPVWLTSTQWIQSLICPQKQQSDCKTKMSAQINKQRVFVVLMIDGCVRLCV